MRVISSRTYQITESLWVGATGDAPLLTCLLHLTTDHGTLSKVPSVGDSPLNAWVLFPYLQQRTKTGHCFHKE